MTQEELIKVLAELVEACTPTDAEPNARGEVRSVRTPDWQAVSKARAVVTAFRENDAHG